MFKVSDFSALRALPIIHSVATEHQSICHSSPLGSYWKYLYRSVFCIHPDHQHVNLYLHACANCLSDHSSLNVREVKWLQIYTDRDPCARVSL